MSGLEDSRFRKHVRAFGRFRFSVLKIVEELFPCQQRILIERVCFSEGYPTFFAVPFVAAQSDVKLNGKYLVHHDNSG